VIDKDDGNRSQIAGFLGVGLDNRDEHKRMTRSEHFLLVGGSAETHERMQDTALRFEEGLRKKGKRLQDASTEEALDLLRDALES
jgi:hypothetical protein